MNKFKYIIGIDPGLRGAIAILSDDGPVVEVMPTHGNILDLVGLKKLIEPYKNNNATAFLEQVASRPGQGVSSTFKFGRTYGATEMALAAFEIPYQLVTPRTWTKVMWSGVEGSLDAKDKNRAIVSRLYPDLDLRESPRCRVVHDGMCDALLIATYGLKLLTGGV